jgi:hypothetical protein
MGGSMEENKVGKERDDFVTCKAVRAVSAVHVWLVPSIIHSLIGEREPVIAVL